MTVAHASRSRFRALPEGDGDERRQRAGRARAVVVASILCVRGVRALGRRRARANRVRLLPWHDVRFAPPAAAFKTARAQLNQHDAAVVSLAGTAMFDGQLGDESVRNTVINHPAFDLLTFAPALPGRWSADQPAVGARCDDANLAPFMGAAASC